GLPTRIRSCALRILLAATISMALVIFCVLLMLAICVRISLAPAIDYSLLNRSNRRAAITAALGSVGLGRLELLVQCLELAFDLVIPVAGGHDVLHRVADLAVGEGEQG